MGETSRPDGVRDAGPAGEWPRAPVIGTPVNVSSFAATEEMVGELVARHAGGYVSCANAYSVTMAHGDPEFRAILGSASIVTADGMSVVWALRALGEPAERVHNDDLLLACCARHPEWRHFLVGGRIGQPEAVAVELGRRFPGIMVVGMHATPQRPVPAAESRAIIDQIHEAAADVVWVGMGTPAQDYWMASVASRSRAVMIGCGSSFDLLSGNVRAAPEWVKRSGLQWVFRLAQEPRRLAFRYFNYNARFLVAFGLQIARRVMHGRGHAQEAGRY